MQKQGPILIIDDDAEDRELCIDSLKAHNCTNEISTFSDGTEALEYLTSTKKSPFLILCDIRMPKMSGIELRQAIDKTSHLRKKSIPFVFLTGSAEPQDVNRAYELSVQGFFVKPNRVEEWHKVIGRILNYWNMCLEPNTTREGKVRT